MKHTVTHPHSVILSICLIVAICLSSAGIRAEEPDPLPLGTAVERALAANPALAASSASIDVAREDLGAARSDLYPSLSGSATRTETDQTTHSQEGFNGGGRSGNTSFGLALDQNIYDFGRRKAGIRLAGNAVTNSEIALESERLSVAWNTVMAYLTWIEAEHAVGVRIEGLELARRHLESAQARLEVGRVSPLDVSKEKVNVANAESNLIASRNSAATALHDLLKLMAAPQITTYTPVEPVDFIPDSIPSVEKLIEIAMNRRPDLKAARLIQEQQRLQTDLAKSGYWPAIGLSGQSSWSGDNTPYNQSVSASLGIRMTFFNGFQTGHSVRSAQAGQVRAAAQTEQLILSLRTEIHKAHTALADADKRETAAGQALQYSKESLALAEGRYEAGLATELELADARQTYLDANDALYRARNVRRTAFAALMAAAGVPYGEETGI